MGKFMPYNGYLMGLPTNENHINFLWCEPGCKVLFSVTRKGQAASCHFASDKAGMKKITRGMEEFRDFLFDLFPWCKVILAQVKIKKVKSIIKKIGFVKIAENNKGDSLYALERMVVNG